MRKALLMQCFLLIIALPRELFLGNLDDLVDEKPWGQEVAEGQQSLQVADVAVDGIGDARVLNFHRHLAPVLQEALVHLPDRRGRDRRVVELVKLAPPVLAELCLHDALQLSGGHHVCVRAHALEGPRQRCRQNRFVLDTQHLSELQSCAAHARQRRRQTLRIGIAHRGRSKAAVAATGAANGLREGSPRQASRQGAESQDALQWCGRHCSLSHSLA
mmetsp:Transcript_3509/g.13874  ORF Transcript_3509/g.13874 Transcript_3509/m.13874 type:complete len:217 (+) Transcript_3509:972-1622(+)